MLLTNQSIINQTLGKKHSGVTNHGAQFRPEVMFNRFFMEDNTNKFSNYRDSFPTGTARHYSYVLGPKGGLLSATTTVRGTGAFAASLTAGKFMTANLAGVGSFEGSMSLITSMAANLAGVGALTGDMKLTLAMAANLAGIGDMSGALSLLIPLNATLEGTGSVIADLKGNADLSATIYVNQSEATTQQLVSAIWNAIASDYNTSGTMGNKLNGAGSAGDPWTTDLSSYTTDGTAGKVLQDAKKKATLAVSLSA